MTESFIETTEDDLDGSRYSISTLNRSFEMLQLLANEGRVLSLTEIVAITGWSKPTTYRLARALESQGAVRSYHREGYALGPRLISLGHAALVANDLLTTARPFLQQLFRQVGESVVLTMLDGDEIVYLDLVQARQILSVSGEVGDRLPAYCTSSGYALLSGLSDEGIRRTLRRTAFKKLTASTPVTLTEVIAHVDEVRHRGYSLNDGELAEGHRSVAVPIRAHDDAVVGALAISTPAARVSLDQLRQFAEESLVPIGAEISISMGFEPRLVSERPTQPRREINHVRPQAK